ncbi:hypothetical protein AB0891_25560 [Streptomyces sp. NPDC007259]|uniref:hypothetical protein n=1 Tax=Streptomyces sp. NPDC007259 TaxID=3154319 RepID=UPI0034515B48
MTSYHWILTLNGHWGPDQTPATVCSRGTLDLPPGETREAVTTRLIEELRSEFLARTGHLLNDTGVTFFALEPNTLP